MENKLGDKIKEIRTTNGLSQDEFAKVLGYSSRSTINKIEKGINDISYDKLGLLIKKFDVAIDELFDNFDSEISNKSFSNYKTERVELTVLCLVEDGNKLLLQNRIKDDWKCYTLPGGHVEAGESFVDAVIREMKEETGLDIINPRLVGVKHFPRKGGRYIVFLFKTNEYKGVLKSSNEGEMEWKEYGELYKLDTVDDFDKLLRVINSDNLNEFQYVISDEKWYVVLK